MNNPQLGFVGLGVMGGSMARNLLAAGYPVTAYDIDGGRMAAIVAERAQPAADVGVVMAEADIVMTSLPYAHTWNEVAEKTIVPQLRKGQIVIDLGTNTPGEARRFGRIFAKKGASLLDAPVSGGGGGAADGTLRMFVSGDRRIFARCLPILKVLGDPDRIVYCGKSGQGHVAKGVNQLGMGLANAAMLEALSLGVNCGLDPAVLDQGIGGDDGWRDVFSRVSRRIADGDGRNVGIKFEQYTYYLGEAAERGIELPITAALHDLMKDAEKVVTEVNRPSPSLWYELAEKEQDE